MTEKNSAEKVTNVAKDKMGSLEDKLSKQAKKMPKLSEANQKMLVTALPWVMGAFGLLLLNWAKDLWDYLRVADAFSGLGAYGGYFSANLPGKGATWVGLILLVLVALLVGFAFVKKILNKSKDGWNFAFYAMVVAVVAGLYYVFMLGSLSSGRGWVTAVVGLVGLYALFQVRSSYK